MSSKIVDWGYILIAPGRPSYDEQIDFMSALGISLDQFGPLWIDEIKRGSTRPRSQLVRRQDALDASQNGDTIHIMTPVCVGLSAADIRWFCETALHGGVRLFVAGQEVKSDDNITMIAGEAARAINAFHVSENRRTGGKRRKTAAEPVREYEVRPCVYRHKAEDGRLLYVGACSNYNYRERKHKTGAEWWPQIANVEFEYFDTMREAFAAEKTAIYFERPEFNRLIADPGTDAFINMAAQMAIDADPDLAARIRALKPKS
ncbi:hypothetical protein [Hoeflea sp.]|uniref:hypothetical protein n=1 Tax=Hoeflea sp. TaxID=1940281 RepID=UPI003B52978E